MVSDFDGTMTRYDFFDIARRHLPTATEHDYWQDYLDGKISHFEAMAAIYAAIRTDHQGMENALASMELDPTLCDSVTRLQAAGWKIIVASAGCEWYIERLLGTALMLNGISMGVCGSSRPASGSEHLISHALDSLSSKPALHGLQVGVATYLVSLLQKQNSETIAALFKKTGFWDAIASDPFKLSDWIEAVRLAPEMKEDFYTVLSSRDCLPEAEHLMRNDPWLKSCFVE